MHDGSKEMAQKNAGEGEMSLTVVVYAFACF